MTLSSADIDSQHVALLPARTVMSMFALGNPAPRHGGGTVSCALSIGDIAAGIGAILGSGTAVGHGTSCSNFS